jgi:hypothetical protein
MSRALRRFEILLPLKFNDGSVVPGELTAKTIVELREKFGAVFVRNSNYPAARGPGVPRCDLPEHLYSHP